jgi:hypothetical protein
MQSQDTSNRVPSEVKHPNAAEWMTYLYDEIAPERKRELHAHLAQCAACGEQLNQWRAGLVALDDWKLPALPRKAPAWQPATMLKWAAAAAVVLCVGFAAGRVNSSHAREMAELKTAVTQLTEKVAAKSAGDANDQSIAITQQTRDELVQLLTDYSKLNEERRTEDRRVVGLALRELDLRLGKLRGELETVALNTESGFQQTKEGLTTLASYAAADHSGAPELNPSETKTNQ